MYESKSDKVQHYLCCGFIETYIQEKWHHQFGREHSLFSLIISRNDNTFDSFGRTKLDSINTSEDTFAMITDSCAPK